MKSLFEKWFCKHKWISHHKQAYKREIFERWQYEKEYRPTGVTKETTEEVLICEKCGKIKKIEY